MAQVKAKEVNICIFTWKNYASVNDATGDDLIAFKAFAGVIQDLRKKHGNVPVYVDFCPLTNPDNQIVISQNGIEPSNLPAAQIWATFDDDTTGQYFLIRGIKDRNGLTWTPGSVAPYVTTLLYQQKTGPQSLLCKMLPVVCKVPRWALLAAAGFSTFEALTSDQNLRRIGYGAAAGLTWNEFFARGGFSDLFK